MSEPFDILIYSHAGYFGWAFLIDKKLDYHWREELIASFIDITFSLISGFRFTYAYFCRHAARKVSEHVYMMCFVTSWFIFTYFYFDAGFTLMFRRADASPALRLSHTSMLTI
jgi:hypothetical protein